MTPENAELLATYAGSRQPGGAPGAGVGWDAQHPASAGSWSVRCGSSRLAKPISCSRLYRPRAMAVST